MKICFTSPVNKAMQIKTTRIHLIPTRMATNQKQQMLANMESGEVNSQMLQGECKVVKPL